MRKGYYHQDRRTFSLQCVARAAGMTAERLQALVEQSGVPAKFIAGRPRVYAYGLKRLKVKVEDLQAYDLDDLKALKAKPRGILEGSKRPREKRPCICGCGRMTFGYFAPGHHGRLAYHAIIQQWGDVAAFVNDCGALPDQNQPLERKVTPLRRTRRG